MKKIFIFTSSFPFDKAKEDSFLIPELEVLKKKFEVTIIPMRKGGKEKVLPEGIVVDKEFSKLTSKKNIMILKVLASSSFWSFFLKEFFSNLRIMFCVECLKNLLIMSVYTISLKKWMEKEGILRKCLNRYKKIIFYSYWLTFPAVAIALLKKDNKNQVVAIARAHGFDLYEYRQKKNYIPYRKLSLQWLDKVILISKNGKEYLTKKYPIFAEKFEYFPMGVKKAKAYSNFSRDDVFRIVSCSFLVPLKRVHLIIQTMEILGNYTRELKWEWTHIGDGPLKNSLLELVKNKCPSNVKINFLGELENFEVIKYYQSNPVDIFILLSETEGRPVSIMEALSVGLPIICSNVGGVSELVENGENGFLFPVNVCPKEIAEKILFLRKNPQILNSMKNKSIEIFFREADAESNYTKFAEFLEKL